VRRVTIRPLGPDNVAVVTALPTYRRLTHDETRAFLMDDDTILLAAFEDEKPVGFVLAHVLRRRHGDSRQLFVYEVDVAASHRRRRIATALLRELESLAVADGVPRGLVITERANVAATSLYRSVGGREADEGEDVGLGFPLRASLTTIRPATAADVDLLVGWHRDPEVSRYWDDETYTPEEMQAELAREAVDTCIVEEAGTPIGYIQAWTDEGRSGGIDMFLIPHARGRGLGPDAARALAQHLRDERGWDRITVDPYVWNEVAIRAWQRAGFEPVEEREPDGDHRDRWLLMVFRD
jgi:aminoglycoside 6'-N-acetyltransferase